VQASSTKPMVDPSHVRTEPNPVRRQPAAGRKADEHARARRAGRRDGGAAALRRGVGDRGPLRSLPRDRVAGGGHRRHRSVPRSGDPHRPDAPRARTPGTSCPIWWGPLPRSEHALPHRTAAHLVHVCGTRACPHDGHASSRRTWTPPRPQTRPRARRRARMPSATAGASSPRPPDADDVTGVAWFDDATASRHRHPLHNSTSCQAP